MSYEKYAARLKHGWQIVHSLFLLASLRAAPVSFQVFPFTGASAQTGSKRGQMFTSNIWNYEKAVTKEEYEKAREKKLKEKTESNMRKLKKNWQVMWSK